MRNSLKRAKNFRSFRQRVNQNSKESVFKSGGGNTFFIPVDEGFKVSERCNCIPLIFQLFSFFRNNCVTEQKCWIAAATKTREDWHEGDRWPRHPQSGAVHQTHPDRGGIRHNGLRRQYQGAGLVLHATGRQVAPRWVIDRFLIGKLPFDWLSEKSLPAAGSSLLWNI